ncbi:MAG TPA: helix-turn-helix transcriptional regulator [Candidatus Xenobia bacterium]|jgi:transcriptional regulator with XRE-family HTH domain
MQQAGKYSLGMFNAIGRYIARWRKEQGWNQAQLAQYLGVSRVMIAHWENGHRLFPDERIARLATTLGVDEARITELCLPAPYPDLKRKNTDLLPPYPVKGSLTDLPAEWSAGLKPAIRDEMEHAFPRDSQLELGAALRFLEVGELCFVRLTDLDCRFLIIEKGTQKAASHLWRHAILMRGKNRTLLIIPQVSMIVVAQSTERRVDFLAWWHGKDCEMWVDIELDGGFHAQTANDDARRAWGLGLPRLGYHAGHTESKDFVKQVAADLTRLESRLR